jgi:hypothetical protein
MERMLQPELKNFTSTRDYLIDGMAKGHRALFDLHFNLHSMLPMMSGSFASNSSPTQLPEYPPNFDSTKTEIHDALARIYCIEF